ncbi:hypothetical protein O0Q50_03330 [Priestia aryabhattai]|uniref:Uncharacterized protein n=1 Tax=Priestia aryabhattai TaxID=412384 RepID=A0AAX6N372_PRIAR|nr:MULTISPECIES: hypothetical protein [Priestia]MDU9690186.1 hypothetical protein [Priestia aryabhattai]MED5244039.1 hypothetical protein [Priestia sp. LL-8]
MNLGYSYFNKSSYSSIILGLISLTFLNMNLLFNTMFNTFFLIQIIGVALGLIGLLSKESRKQGLWGIFLNTFPVIFIVVVSILSLTINYQP